MTNTLTSNVVQHSVVRETANYSVFKTLAWNRDLKRSLIDKLKASMTAEGFASYAPILVNANMEILDGQHRFVAAQELGISVKYMVVDVDTEIDALILMNTNKLPWSPDDFAKYFATKGNPYYQGLVDFAKRHKVSCGIAYTFIHGTHIHASRAEATAYQQGKWNYTIEDLQQAEKDITATARVLELLNMPFRRTTYRALITLSKYTGFEWERMIDKAMKYRDRAYTCSSLKGYIQMFLDIYNFKARIDSVLHIGER